METGELGAEPGAGIVFAVAEHHGSGLDGSDELEQFFAVGVGGEVKFQHFAAASDVPVEWAEVEGSAGGSVTESAGGGGGIGVADEEDTVPFVLDHAEGEVVGGGVGVHHSGGEDEQTSAAEFHVLDLSSVEDLEVEGLGEGEVTVVAVGAMGLEVVDFGEDPAEASDVDGLPWEPTGLHEQGELGEDFLGSAEGEDGDEDGAFAGVGGADGLGETFDFGFPGEAGGWGTGAAGCFHDDDVGLDILETCALEEGLVAEGDVTGVEESGVSASDHDAGGAEGVAGVEEFEGGGDLAGAGFGEGSPFDFAVVAEALEGGLDFVDFVVGVEGVVGDAEFVALAGHDIDGVVEDSVDDEVAELRHEDVGLGEVADGDGEGADVIVVAVADDDGVEVGGAGFGVEREGFTAFVFGVDAGVEEESMTFEFDEPGAGADVVSGIEVGDFHGDERGGR